MWRKPAQIPLVNKSEPDHTTDAQSIIMIYKTVICQLNGLIFLTWWADMHIDIFISSINFIHHKWIETPFFIFTKLTSFQFFLSIKIFQENVSNFIILSAKSFFWVLLFLINVAGLNCRDVSDWKEKKCVKLTKLAILQTHKQENGPHFH